MKISCPEDTASKREQIGTIQYFDYERCSVSTVCRARTAGMSRSGPSGLLPVIQAS
ncbi:MAG: hypothetical protein J6N70_03535 [Oribacterium sp.]|nr:hypothetical protein [Oribacterium sp.]